jgi:branched-chain amino acid transport system substrate-binding protein
MAARKVRALARVASVGALVLLASACGAAGGGGGAHSGPIKVGFVVPYSGSVARYGQDADQAWALAAEKYGVDVNGRKITPVKYDDKCTPAAAASAVKQALGSGVVALYGPTCSGNVLATQQMAAQNKVPMITGAYSPDITAKGNKYVWRMPPSDAVLNADLAKYLVKKGWNELGVLHDNTGFGQAEGKTITDGFKALGVTSKVDLTYQVGATDFSGEIQRLKSAGVKTVCLEGYDPDTARIALQMHQLGLTANVCGNQELSYDDSLQVAGDVLNGAYYYSVYLPDSKKLAPFTKAWRAKYNADPNPEQYEYYLGAVAVIQAIKNIKGDITPQAVNTEMSKLNFDVDGFTTLAFTDTGDPKCPTVLIGTIAGGKPQTVQEDNTTC